MTTRTVSRPLALLLVVLLLAGCATTNLPPVSQAGAGFRPANDELALWQEARQEERQLRGAADLYDDPLLEDYLEGIVHRLTPSGMAANPHVAYSVSVLADPTLNAFAYPHGALYVHTGLLAQMENESQLATVLGHEMSHVEYRHMLRQRRSMRNKQVGFAVASVAAAVILESERWHQIDEGDWSEAALVGLFGDVILPLGLQLAFMASVNGYGRDLELEADEVGFRKLAAAGYDVRQAPKVYETLLADAGKDAGKLETFFFGSHPRLSERIESADSWVAARGAGSGEAVEAVAVGVPPEPVGDDAEFRRRLGPVVRDDARMALEAGWLEEAQAGVAKALDWRPEDPRVYLLLAELRLAQAEADAAAAGRLREEAREALHRAVLLDADLPEPHRELGWLYLEDGALGDACRELGFYLELAPADAEDLAEVLDRVREIEAAGGC